MRGALLYLLAIRFKNQLKSLLKSPAKLIFIVFIIAFIVITVLSGNNTSSSESDLRDLRELYAGITAVYTIMYLLIGNNGFNKGSSMFTMSDVNLIFTGPFHTQKVLFYGLFRQMATSLMLCLFLVFQYPWLHLQYGIGYGTILLVMLGYALVVFYGQITAMLLYSFTSADEDKRKVTKMIFYGVYILFAAYLGFSVYANRFQMMEQLLLTANGSVIHLMPVSGWIGAIISGVLTFQIETIIVGSVLCIIFLIVMIRIIIVVNNDFYEDVINTAQIYQSAITAQKEGKINEVIPRNIKVGKIGFEKGYGAQIFYYKHKIENRRSQILLFTPTTLMFATFIILYSFIMKNVGISAVFIMATYMQLFSVALGRFNRELIKPYIYLIPEPPFQKLLYALKESLPSFVIEAIVIFVPVSIILSLSPIEAVLCIIARVSFSGVFTAANIAEQRLFGSISSKVFMMIFYLVIILIIAVPGIALAIILSLNDITLISVDATIFMSLIVCNIPITLLLLYLCRNMLEYAELNNR